MKRLSLVFTLLLVMAAVSAPTPAGAKPAPSRAPGDAQKQPAPGSAPQVKSPPQAKTQAEFKDYNAAYAVSGGAQVEAAADAFAAKYPSSELRAYLFAKALHEYQIEDNRDKMLAMGEKVLTLDPDNAIALVLTAALLSDQLKDEDPGHAQKDEDPDRAQKIAAIKKNATHALDTLGTMPPPAGATPEQIEAFKDTLRSMAYSSLGILELKTGDDPGAEREMKAALGMTKAPPDPYVWYHLALAQDHQKKYREALASVEQALRYIGSNADLGKLATDERDRLRQLTGGPQGAPSPAPPPL